MNLIKDQHTKDKVQKLIKYLENNSKDLMKNSKNILTSNVDDEIIDFEKYKINLKLNEYTLVSVICDLEKKDKYDLIFHYCSEGKEKETGLKYKEIKKKIDKVLSSKKMTKCISKLLEKKQKKKTTLDFILEEHDNVIIADGFDDAVIGIEKKTKRVVYSMSKIIEMLQDEGLSEEDAVDHFYFNISGSIIENGPIYVEDWY